MVNHALKIVSFSILMLVLAIPSMAQNTKGDKPTANRESRFKKTGKEKPAKRIRSNRRTTSSLRAYKPRKKSKGGERAGRPTAPIYTSRPSERPRKVYPQSGRYVNNNSYDRKRSKDGDKARASRFPAGRVSPRSSTGRTRNVYPQSGRFVNHSSPPVDRNPRRKVKVTPRSASRSFIARRSVRSWTHLPKPKPRRERAVTKDIAGRKLRTKNFETKRPAIIKVPGVASLSSTPRNKNVYPQTKRIASSPAKKSRNVYPQSDKFVGNYQRRPKQSEAISNRSQIARLYKLQGAPDKRPGKKRKVVPRSASRPFIARKSPNTWAHFPRPKRKSERAITTDIAGRPLRTKNFETKRPAVLVNPTSRPYTRKQKLGDRPYTGDGGGYSSATRSGKAWRGDVTNRRIRKNYSSKRGFEGQPVLTPEKRRIGMRDQGEGYSGNIKSGRPLKGGGSLSGRLWNNQGRAVPARTPGIGGRGVGKYQGNIKFGKKGFNNQGEEYTGNIKTGRPLKGGGSVSGKLWNNRQQAIPSRTPGVGARGLGKYQGNIKFEKKGFNNQGEEYSGNIKATSGRKTFNDQGEEYTGNIKSRRPLKGGGSVSGKLWNNRQTPVAVRTPTEGAAKAGRYSGNLKAGKKIFNDQGEEYSGNIKSHRPLKGGGSVSGKLWNNRQTPVAVRTPTVEAAKAGKYSGNIKAGKKVFNDQGEEYTGNIKTRRPAKGGGSVSGKLWNNKETPVAVRTPTVEAAKAGKYAGDIKAGRKVFNDQGEEYTGDIKVRKGYDKNPNSADEALKVRKPKTTYDVDGLQVKVKRPEYGYRKNAPEGSIPGLKPTKASIKASEYARGMKQYQYVRNPNSAEGALKVRETGKAFARATDYQGNIKMKKFDLFGRRDLHPDAQFVKLNKNNVAEEKDMLTNFKLWWSRLFKKNDTLPDHLKDKRGKPRYDKGESGLWYD